MKSSKMVYQFKITLKEIKPPVWRRIQVPEDYSFWDLHVAIQDSMGWTDTHLHHFEILNPMSRKEEEIGIPDTEFCEADIKAGWKKKIAGYFSVSNAKAKYVYDYGDNWEHAVLLEKIIPEKPGARYPLCLKGGRSCPPEDCGGPWGYQDFLDIIMDPGHEEYQSMLEWAGGDFRPEHFDPAEVVFDDPKKRLKFTLEN
jgi:hypothetical protein